MIYFRNKLTSVKFRIIKTCVIKISYICSRNLIKSLRDRRDARVVDWGGLENRCPGNWTGGSNPSLSADHSTPVPSVTEQVFYFTEYRTGLARVRDDGK